MRAIKVDFWGSGVFTMLLVFTLAIGCETQISGVDDEILKSLDTTMTLIGEGELYGAGKEDISQENFVIRKEKNWVELMSKMDEVNSVTKSFNETDIDFSKFEVIAIFDTIRESGGYKLQITQQFSQAEITYHIVHSTPAGPVTTVIAQPYYIFKIAKSNLPVLFKDNYPYIYNR